MMNFGQMPKGALAALQMPVFALVGALSTVQPPDTSPVPTPSSGGGYTQTQPDRLDFTEHPEELLEVLELLLINDLL